MWSNFLDVLSNLTPIAYNIILVVLALLCGLLIKVAATLGIRYYSKKQDNYSFFRSLVLRLHTPLTIFLPVVVLNFMLPALKLSEDMLVAVGKAIEVLIIVSFAWLLIAGIKMSEDYVYHAMDLKRHDNLRQRKIRTQLRFLRKIGILLIVALAIGAILLTFNNLRRVGTGLLTGVGISGIIVGLAAQRSLSNLLAGFQIAFTQPIRLDDVVVVEGEWGKVEEINLTYVVVNIWDQRRLILPINYFLEKPFQNWTRTTAQIMGTVFLYLDFNAPIDAIRQKFDQLLKSSPLWDGRVGAIQVTNATAQTIEVRALMSAENSGKAFDLRCMVREQLVAYIHEHHPGCLPKTRAMVGNDADFLTADNHFAKQDGQTV